MLELMSSNKNNEVQEELADVVYFALRFAQMNDIDLSLAIIDKIEKTMLNTL